MNSKYRLIFTLFSMIISTQLSASVIASSEEIKKTKSPAKVIMITDYNVPAEVIYQAKLNIEDLISMIQVATNSLVRQRSPIDEMLDLSIKATAGKATAGEIDDNERTQLNTVYKVLRSSFQTNAETTKHNGISLFDHSTVANEVRSQVGPSATDMMAVLFPTLTLEGVRLNSAHIDTYTSAIAAITSTGDAKDILNTIYGQLCAQQSYCNDIIALRDLEINIQKIKDSDNLLLVTAFGVGSLNIARDILVQMAALAVQSNAGTVNSMDRAQIHDVFQIKRNSLQHILRTAAWNTEPLFKSESGITFTTQDGPLANESITFLYLATDIMGAEFLKVDAISVSTQDDARIAGASLFEALGQVDTIHDYLMLKQREFNNMLS